MKLSPEKINHLAHLITNNLKNDDCVEFLTSKNEIRKFIKELILAEMRLDAQVDKLARQRIQSLSKAPPEGSREWDILYRKTFEEIMKKKRGVL